MALNFANNNSLSAITALPASITGGALNLISTQTASSSSTIDFTSGIDSTYKEYIFKFINLHASSDGPYLMFQGNASGGSGFNETITSTYFIAYNHEDGTTGADVGYSTGGDLANGTGFQRLCQDVGNGNDESVSGTLHLFDPSNTTFVKHFIARASLYDTANGNGDNYTAGYFNTTSAIDEIQFKFEAGNIDSGVIKLYGVS